jgi:tetratricopeptide (TPR) repeat protein
VCRVGARSGRVVDGLKLVLDLVGHAHEHKWIWSWCATSVAEFGTFDPEALTLSLAFWRHFLEEHPDNAAGAFAQLNCAAVLHRLDPVRASRAGFTFERFEKEAIALMHLDGSVRVVARLWDWIGHWAQEDEDWAVAAAAYGEANSLDTASYGYCFGIALLQLGRYADAHEVLLRQALDHQPDALSWAQVAVARENLGDLPGAIEAYKRSITIEPDYALGWFNLGGVYWNHGNYTEAESTWSRALERFPDHELAGEASKNLHALIARRLASVPSG